MEKIMREITVEGVSAAPPFVRVNGFFLEGGTEQKSHTHTEIAFLVNSFEQPQVGDVLLLTIEGQA